MAVSAQNVAARQRRFFFGGNQDVILAVCVIAVLVILLLPIPTWMLDVMLTINISLSVIIMLGTIYLQRPAEFSVFPSLLLMLTLFRLSLNVASTRLILAQANAGNVINAFGGFVTAGNLFVGIVIFIILVVIQFVVITRGATRISEVAARFTLDAMPGKQMGVDADLNSGLITEQQARQRRRRIEQEADFYGAMDGATKFVRGDAIAAIIITLVNIIFGLIIGMIMLGLEFGEAAQIYTTLTIGDGLVSQIPALIISTAAGLVVTRASSEENLGVDVGAQFTRYPRALGIAALMLALFGLVPGMPTLAFLFVAGLLSLLTYSAVQAQEHKAEEARQAEMAQEAAEEQPEARTEDLLTVDPLKIELGYGLVAMADPRQGGDLLTRIQIIRQQIATRMGIIVPVIRIVDNMRLRANEYQVRLRESVIASYELMPDHFLAMNPGLADEDIDGIPTTEPAFGLSALWVGRHQRDRAERLGYTIIEPSAVLATHLTELIYAHADELLTREDVQVLVNHLKESAPTVVDELLPNILTYGELQKVLHLLLRERVSVRNLETICEVLCDYGARTKDPEILAEYCRHALAREICGNYADENGVLRVITVDPALEQEILDAINRADTGEFIPLSPERADLVAERTAQAVQPLLLQGMEPVILTSAPVRRFYKRIVERHVPKIVVLSLNEIDPAMKLESEGQVTL
ncbi:MAG: flagellar biosynthesis protein FlhA [Candidatus Hydrogenedentota bacterium]